MKFKVIKFDGTEIESEQEIDVNGVKKPASIDDIERSEISQLITLLDDGTVAHNILFEDGSGKKAVWRRTSGVTTDGTYKQLYCLSGYTLKGELKLDRILPDGTIESAEGESIQLHEKEL